jgi:hypothetical protein
MKTTLTAIALAAALVQPAAAVTFPTLTTIYVGSGVLNSSGGPLDGQATAFHCTNVSGVTATIRYLVLQQNGSVAGSLTLNAPHGSTTTAATHLTAVFASQAISPGVNIFQGGINIESTQSGVFCTAMIVDASTIDPVGIALHLVRVNPHPGTVE